MDEGRFSPPAEEGSDRTSEIELLISGGVVFTLVQLPAVVARVFERLEPHVAGWWSESLFLAQLYLSVILYTLIVSFVLHLTARAYWIGLIGLEKVYPNGIVWDNIKHGPLIRRFYQERVPPLRTRIKRVDAFCSTIFSFAFLIVYFCLVSILMVLLIGLLAWGLSRWLFGGERLGTIFWVILIGFSLLNSITWTMDKKRGDRLPPESRMARAILGVQGFSYRLQWASFQAPISLVLFSNTDRRKLYPLLAGVLIGTMTLFTVDQVIKRRGLQVSNLADVPPEQEIRWVHYEDQWPEGGPIRPAPSIQSDMIRDPYLKLFLPYVADRHEPAFAARCPDPRERLACVARLHDVRLDGRPVPGLTFHFYTHPASGASGFLAYLPTESLPRGDHLLRIEALPNPRRKGAPGPKPYFIRFWI